MPQLRTKRTEADGTGTSKLALNRASPIRCGAPHAPRPLGVVDRRLIFFSTMSGRHAVRSIVYDREAGGHREDVGRNGEFLIG